MRATFPLPTSSFTQAQCEALFDAIDHDDDVDFAATLPKSAPVAVDTHGILQSYGLSLALWERNARRRELAGMVGRCLCHGRMDGASMRRFKHARATFKQLRFACALVHADHVYPRYFHAVTAAMGQLQDTLKHAHGHTRWYALRLRMLLGWLPYRWGTRDVYRFEPTSAPAFAEFIQAEMRAAGTAVGAPSLSGRAFHQLRKIIGRQAAFQCALNVVAPSRDGEAVFRYLATINGLMGSLHDELVAAYLAPDDPRTERDAMEIPEPIASRIRALVAWHGA